MPTSRLPVVNANLYPSGHLVLQNLPSLVCGWVINAQPNECILDMCAAPGNKTMHMAEMSNNMVGSCCIFCATYKILEVTKSRYLFQACITAIDKTSQKVERLKANAVTQSVTCVKSYAFDSTKCYSETSTGISHGPPFPENSFDKVLLDAPCSGLGQRPQLLNKITPKILSSYKFVQRKLMAAVSYLSYFIHTC